MAWLRLLFASLVLAILFLHEALGGPAHSLAMAMVARAAKIPRTIRAPFRNTEMMTARGFGKRSQELYPSYGSVQSALNGAEDDLSFDQDRHQFSINWIVKELLDNPDLLRQLLRRFVDVDDDGIITQRELLGRLD